RIHKLFARLWAPFDVSTHHGGSCDHPWRHWLTASPGRLDLYRSRDRLSGPAKRPCLGVKSGEKPFVLPFSSVTNRNDLRRCALKSASEVSSKEVCPRSSPELAVIIPCWNAEPYVARAIESVINQNYPELEIIVIDDGSADKSLEIIRSFGNRVRWETGPNRGSCAARNRGLFLSTAKYVLFLDADDYLDDGYLSN